MVNNIIDRIRIRPGSYLGKHSITNLNHFLDGYITALTDNGQYNNQQKKLLPLSFWYMHELTAVAYGFYESTLGWCKIILNSLNGNEHAALDRFFELYDEFKSIRISTVKCAVIDNENLQHCLIYGPYHGEYNTNTKCDVKQDPVFSEPQNVCILSLVTDGGIQFDMLIVECADRTVIFHKFFADIGERAELGSAEQYAGKLFGKLTFEHYSETDNYSFKNDEVYLY